MSLHWNTKTCFAGICWCPLHSSFQYIHPGKSRHIYQWGPHKILHSNKAWTCIPGRWEKERENWSEVKVVDWGLWRPSGLQNIRSKAEDLTVYWTQLIPATRTWYQHSNTHAQQWETQFDANSIQCLFLVNWKNIIEILMFTPTKSTHAFNYKDFYLISSVSTKVNVLNIKYVDPSDAKPNAGLIHWSTPAQHVHLPDSFSA